jgi:NAD(P)-dependent dehydrogenase (short-subunit alcohol dehydrogenase family)
MRPAVEPPSMIPAGLDSVLDDGDVALVTGSTSGIGRETARNLADTGATVLVHGRDAERARETVAGLPGEGHGWYLADFADLSDVRDLAGDVLDDHDRLDCLVNNAGTWQGERRLVDVPGSEAGVEFTFAVNHLATFLLTHLLADRLNATGDKRDSGPDENETGGEADDGDEPGDDEPEGDGPGPDPARVVTVSSGLHRRATLDLDAVRGPDGPDGVDAYALSKLANVLFTAELSRRLPETVTANCCHPGTSPATALARDGSFLPGLGWRLLGVVGKFAGVTDTPAEAAETPTYLATSPDVGGLSGEYFEGREAVPPGDGALDRDAQQELWRVSVEWTGIEESQSLPAE